VCVGGGVHLTPLTPRFPRPWRIDRGRSVDWSGCNECRRGPPTERRWFDIIRGRRSHRTDHQSQTAARHRTAPRSHAATTTLKANVFELTINRRLPARRASTAVYSQTCRHAGGAPLRLASPRPIPGPCGLSSRPHRVLSCSIP